MAVKDSKENLPCLPTLRRAALARARKTCRISEQSAKQRKNMLVACPQTLLRLVWSTENQSKKYAKKRPHKDKESLSSRNPSIISRSSLMTKQRMSSPWYPMTNQYLRKIRENYHKRCNNEQAKADTSEDGCTYGIYCLNICKVANDSLIEYGMTSRAT